MARIRSHSRKPSRIPHRGRSELQAAIRTVFRILWTPFKATRTTRLTNNITNLSQSCFTFADFSEFEVEVNLGILITKPLLRFRELLLSRLRLSTLVKRPMYDLRS